MQVLNVSTLRRTWMPCTACSHHTLLLSHEYTCSILQDKVEPLCNTPLVITVSSYYIKADLRAPPRIASQSLFLLFPVASRGCLIRLTGPLVVIHVTVPFFAHHVLIVGDIIAKWTSPDQPPIRPSLGPANTRCDTLHFYSRHVLTRTCFRRTWREALSCSVWIDSHIYMFRLGLISHRY
jgi:hypothetical protein